MIFARGARLLRSPFLRAVTLVGACAASVSLGGCASTADVASSREARLDAIPAEWDRPDSPGGVLAVIENGRIVHVKPFGMANLEHGIPNSVDTVFDIGSTSKQFTASCVALLEQQGKLSLTDDVRKHVPELRDYGHTITLRHLLNHTSGLRDYLVLYSLAGVSTEDYTTKEGALDLIARQYQLDFEPGSEWAYSNTGYFLLSIVVERVSNLTLPRFAAQYLFEPLGMTHTHVHDDHKLIVPRRAQAYTKREDGTFGIDMSDFEQTGDGAVMTTVGDLALWDENFYTGRVGTRLLIDTLQTRAKRNDGKELGYALGLMLGEHRGLPTVRHGGAWAGYRAELLRFPGEHTSFVCLANLSDVDASALCHRAADVWLESKLTPVSVADAKSTGAPSSNETVSAPPASAEAKAPFEPSIVDIVSLRGTYESEELAVKYVIRGEDRNLEIGVVGRGYTPMTPIEHDVWDVGGAKLTVLHNANGRIVGFSIDAGRVRRLTFLRPDALTRKNVRAD